MTEDKMIFEDAVLTAISQCVNGMRRVDLQHEGWTIKAYWVGKIIRIDLTHEKWGQE